MAIQFFVIFGCLALGEFVVLGDRNKAAVQYYWYAVSNLFP